MPTFISIESVEWSLGRTFKRVYTNDAKEMRDRYWQIVGDVGGLG